MVIGIIGAGNIGGTAAQLFAKAGHHVTISHSGDPQTLTPLASSIGENITVRTAEDTVRYSQVILLAVPWVQRSKLPNAQLFVGKIVIDALNPYEYAPNGSIRVVNLEPSTSSEEVLKLIPDSRLVKAFNTLNSETLRRESRPGAPLDQRLVLFEAGDETEAKEVVARLIEDIGYAAVDTGFLKEGGRLQQPGSPIYNVPLTVEEARQKLENLP